MRALAFVDDPIDFVDDGNVNGALMRQLSAPQQSDPQGPIAQSGTLPLTSALPVVRWLVQLRANANFRAAAFAPTMRGLAFAWG